MSTAGLGTIPEHFAHVKDPRINRTKDHPLINIIVIAICGVICGADGWTGVEEFGKSKQAWLARYLAACRKSPLDTDDHGFSLVQMGFYPCKSA